ncbi:MAG: hypothetical protein C0440_00485 [Candidatus Pelagibacter sp.]|nr:hypothetical protein [Candidatus Pelagibacter sp.]
MKQIFVKLRSHLKKRRMKFDLLTSFFVLKLMTVIFITVYMHQTHTKSLLDTSEILMKSVSEVKIDSILDRYTAIERALMLGSNMIQDIKDVEVKNARLIKYMVRFVEEFPYVESIFIALESGRFFQIKTVIPRSKFKTINEKMIPLRVKYAVRVLDNNENNKKEVWYYIDQNLKVIETEQLSEQEITLNFFTRQWYKSVFESDDLSWSPIYIFSTTNLPGIAGSYPLKDSTGKTIGAIGSDVHLKSMAQILNQNTFMKYDGIIGKTAAEGISLVINAAGEVIAHPTETDTAKVLGADVKLLPLESLTDKKIFYVYKIFKEKNKKEIIFDYNNIDYIAHFTEFKEELFKDWIFVTILPIDVFVGAVKEAQFKVLLVSLLILIVSTLLISYLTTRISKPVNELVRQADRIRVFDLGGIPMINSNIYEIQKLQESIARMRRSLEAFGKFVPKNLVKQLIDRETEVKIGGTKRKLTIFFSDIAGFTSISEKTTPDRLMAHLSDYFEEMTRIVMSENGTIDKFIGDAIMAFWGAPQSDAKQALHACQAALFCQRRLIDLNRQWTYEKKPIFETRIGLHTGEVIVGNLGSSERMNYTIIGDAVNLAARLEGVNKLYGTNIIISDSVYKEIQEFAVTRPLDIVAVKGKKNGIPIYELMALKGVDPYLLPTTDQLHISEWCTKAFKLFLDMKFNEALEIYQELQKKYPSDKTIDVYIRRTLELVEEPPGNNWDKTTILTEK